MSRAPAVLVLIAAGALAVSAAGAQPTPEVKGLTIVPGPGPAVTSTYPAAGASVPGGALVLKLVFDQPMAPGAWAYGPSPDGDTPDCLAKPRLLADQRTFLLLCSLAENHRYAVAINPVPRFASTQGRSAQPYELKFSTTNEMTRALHDALAQAGLDDTDDPIMTWGDPGTGVPESPAPP
jgi:hypothetical protein